MQMTDSSFARRSFTRERIKNDSLITVDVHAKNHFSPPSFFSLSLSLLHFFPRLSSRFSCFFFFSHVSSEHRTRKVVQRTSLFPEETRKICHHRVDRIVRIFNLAKRSFEESTYGGGEACFLSTSRYDVKRPHLV